MEKQLNAKGQGTYTYDHENDVLLFKIKGRYYEKSLEFENFVIDLDREGFITALQIFDASKLFKISKFALKNIQEFEFSARAEEGIISVELRFVTKQRNKQIVRQGENFVREAVGITNSSVQASLA